jgi:hypothetical protein
VTVLAQGRWGRAGIAAVLTSAILLRPSGSALAEGKKKESPPPVRLTMSATAERLPLPPLHGPIELTIDALSRIIRLRPSKDAPAALATKLVAHAGSLCPKVAVHDGAVELTCRTRRIEAQLTAEGKDKFLDINELRGLPWRPGSDAAPNFFYDPWRVGLGQGCLAKAGVAHGECELKDGHILQAASQFRASLGGQHRQMASLRLGDLALRTGDPLTASGWYKRVGSYGVFGRMASQRLCELLGDCLESTEDVLHAFDASGLPEPLRAESLIRAARAEAYMGRVTSAVSIIADQIEAHGVASICREEAELLCRRLLLQGMREEARMPLLTAHPAVTGPVASAHDAGTTAHDGGAPVAAALPGDAGTPAAAPTVAEEDERSTFRDNLMKSYLGLPNWDKGPLAVELAEAGAVVATRMGAPDFAGSLLASSAREVPDARLSDHLLAAVEAFLRAEDLVRAHVVAEYMASRLGPKGRVSERWKAALKTLAARSEADEMTSALRAQIEKETEATLAGLKDADAAVKKAKALLGDLKAATKEASASSPPPLAKEGGV